VSVTGNGTNTITVEGPIVDVNEVLATLTYTPAVVGVDRLVVIASDGADAAVGQVTILVNEDGAPPIPDDGSDPPPIPDDGSDPPPIPDDGSDPPLIPDDGSDPPPILDSGSDTDEGGSPRPVITAPGIPLGPSTLFEISQIPNTVIRGEAPGGTVPDGDVFVRVVATNGTLRIPPEQIGDTFLIEQGIFSGAEIFGLSFGGATVPQFTGSIRVCLRGTGTFYYRDVTGMPRTTVTLPTILEAGFTCAQIPNSGTIVLVGSNAPTTVMTQNSGMSSPASTASRPLPEGCMVTTNNIINLREGPDINQEIIRPIPFDVTLTAFEQSGDWYFVDYLGLRGWMNAGFVSPDGC